MDPEPVGDMDSCDGRLTASALFHILEDRMHALKAQDVVVLLKLISLGIGAWTYESLSEDLGISASQIHRSLVRASGAHLYDREDRRVHRRNLSEFLLHGVKYAFPAQPGARSRGVPTGRSAAPLSMTLAGQGTFPLVWPSESGELIGDTVEPLHGCVVHATSQDALLYELLALIDSLRVGAARERSLASGLLAERLT